jgi:hypothetical protein
MVYIVVECRKRVSDDKNWQRKKLGWSTFAFRVVILDPIAASS